MIDLESLRAEIKVMTPRKRLFRVLKEGLTEIGYWQNRPRGNPKRGFESMKDKLEGSFGKGK